MTEGRKSLRKFSCLHISKGLKKVYCLWGLLGWNITGQSKARHLPGLSTPFTPPVEWYTDNSSLSFTRVLSNAISTLKSMLFSKCNSEGILPLLKPLNWLLFILKIRKATNLAFQFQWHFFSVLQPHGLFLCDPNKICSFDPGPLHELFRFKKLASLH